MPNRSIRACIALLAVCLGCAGNALATDPPANDPPILTLTETDSEGREHQPLKITGGSTSRRAAPVDINSQIRIQIERGEIRRRIAASRGGGQAAVTDLLNRAKRLDEIAQGVLPDLQLLTNAATSGTELPPPVRRAVRRRLLNALNEVGSLVPAPSPERDALNLLSGASIPEDADENERNTAPVSTTNFFTGAAIAARSFARQAQTLEATGTYISIGAFLNSNDRSLHLPNFDTQTEGPINIIERFVLVLTPEQTAQLQGYAALAPELNTAPNPLNAALRMAATEARNALRDEAGNLAARLKTQVKEPFTTFIAGLRTDFDADSSVISNLPAPAEGSPAATTLANAKTALTDLKDALTDLEAAVDAYVGELQTVTGHYGASATPLEGAALLAQTNADFNVLVTGGQTLSAAANVQIERITTAINTIKRVSVPNLKLPGRIVGASPLLKTALKTLTDTLGSEIRRYVEKGNGLLKQREIDTSLFQMSEAVLKLDVDAMEKETALELKRSGPRVRGDIVVVRVVLGIRASPPFAGGVPPADKVSVIEEVQVPVYRTLGHTVTAVNLIFANNGHRWRAAPSYSILYRRDSSNIFHNEFLNPGIGINIAALNFGGDSSGAEIGVGAVASFFRDYIQVGYGLNFNRNAGYGFIGLKLPLGGLGGR